MKTQEEGGKEFQILKVNRYEVEQNAVFLDYDVNSLLSQIDNYPNEKFPLRLSLSKNLNTIRDVLAQHPRKLSQLLCAIAADHEEMQVQLMAYFKHELPHKFPPEHYQELSLDPLLVLAKGQYLEIKQESCNIISQLALILKPEDKKSIISFAEELANSSNEQDKISAIQLLTKLTPGMPTEQKESLFSEQFLSIHKNGSVRVKKEIILELGILADNLSLEFVESSIIKKFYLEEVHEHSWGIRKACIEIITPLLCATKNCKQDLASVMETFLKDGNKFVRIAAHKALPEFLAKYGDKNVPEKLFDYYVKLIDLDINNQVSKSNEIIEKVAYYYPGVLQTVGRNKWPQLKKLFNRLLHSKSEDVKLPIAESLFAIGSIIGPEQSKETLFGALDYILKEPSDYLKLCAIKNLAKFVEQFEKQTRENLIDVFLVLQKDPKKWRVRYSISRQLKELSHIYEPETIFKYIFPISLKLCNDGVHEVRTEASHQIVHVINNFKSEGLLYEMAIESLKGYAASEKYIQRQTFCLMLESLFEETQEFDKNFYSTMEKLAQDPVTIVRITLAISLNNIKEHHQLPTQKFSSLISILSQDPEVAEYFDQQQPEE